MYDPKCHPSVYRHHHTLFSEINIWHAFTTLQVFLASDVLVLELVAEHRWYFYQATFGQNSGHFTLTIKECITIALCMQSIPVVDSVHVNLIRGTSVSTQNNKSYISAQCTEQLLGKF